MKCAAPSWGRASVDCFVAVKADEPWRQHLQWQPRPRQVRRKKTQPSERTGWCLVCITNKGRLGSLHGCSGVICSVSFSSVVWFELVWSFHSSLSGIVLEFFLAFSTCYNILSLTRSVSVEWDPDFHRNSFYADFKNVLTCKTFLWWEYCVFFTLCFLIWSQIAFSVKMEGW